MRIGLLGALAVHDDAGRPVQVGGHRVRLLLILLAVDAGKVVPAYSLIERLWEEEPPANSGNALQSLVSRLRAALRQAGAVRRLPPVTRSRPGGYCARPWTHGAGQRSRTPRAPGSPPGPPPGWRNCAPAPHWT